MTKTLLLSTLLATGLCANMFSDMARTQVQQEVGSTASSLLPEQIAPKKPSLKDTAIDAAAEAVVGSDPLKKAVAKEVIKKAL